MTPSAEQLRVGAIDALSDLRKHYEETLSNEQWISNSLADTEAPALGLLVLGNVSAVELLARQDVAFAVAAAGPARAAWEAAVTAAWLLQPDSIPDREMRWAGLLKAERDDWARLQKEFSTRQGGSDAVRLMAEEVSRIDAILAEAEGQLKAVGVTRISRVPDFRGRLESLGKERQYFMYIHASQLVHPGTRALEHVRSMKVHSASDLGPSYGYRTRAGQWALILGLAGDALMLTAESMVKRLTADARLSDEGLQAWERLSAAVGVLGRAS